jgi:hypothetical protein
MFNGAPYLPFFIDYGTIRSKLSSAGLTYLLPLLEIGFKEPFLVAVAS